MDLSISYGFFKFIILITIMSVFRKFLLKNILSCCNVTEEIIITAIGLFCVFLAKYIFYDKKSLSDLSNTLFQKHKQLPLKFLILIGLVSAGLYLKGFLYKQEDLLRFTPFKNCFTIILIAIFTLLFIRKELSYQVIIGIMFIIFGLYFLDTYLQQ